MKPYKIIQSKNPMPRRHIIMAPIKPPKRIPPRLFMNVHPPEKVKFVIETNESNPS
jgi:hypothetical protein